VSGRFDGRVAVVTGAGRGQGREHAVRFAAEGAHVVVIDLCEDIDALSYSLASRDDLAETVRLVEAEGAKALSIVADVRDQQQLDTAFRETVAAFGRVDVVVANAGVVSGGLAWEIGEDEWHQVVDINLGGVWRTARAAIAPMVAAGNGGSMVFIGSLAGMRGIRNAAAYVAAKHGLVGLMRTLANELAEHQIRVNTVHPTNVASDMLLSDANYKLFRPDLENPTKEDAIPAFTKLNLLPIPWLEPSDVSNAVLWLASDEARYITGVELPVDAGGFVRTAVG
jgi:SDR family mycofactocin-dependent oxidoreductase